MTSVTASPALRWVAVPVAAALALLAVEVGFGGRERLDLSPPAARLSLTGVASDYDEALRRATLHAENVAERAERLDDGWLVHDIAARGWLTRARLRGSYDDYAKAEAALRRGFAAAGPGTGPHMSAAVLAFSMHRLPEIERNLDRIAAYAVPPDGGDLAETVGMRGDIAFYRGDYAEALEAYDAADRISPGAATFRRAIYHSKTGRPDLAEDYFDRAERETRHPTAQLRGNFELQRGILDLERGRWDEALTHFRKADRIFPGHWLIEEHIAEVTALKGDAETAEALYMDIVRRTGHPEFMDALAALAKGRGDTAAKVEWIRRADAAWRKRLGQFPEASYGHAIDHCVQKGDWTCALNLARRNHQARPYGEARIALAGALLRNGRASEAKMMIEDVLRSPWRSASLHAVAAEIYGALGQKEPAAEQRRLALALDPHSLS